MRHINEINESDSYILTQRVFDHADLATKVRLQATSRDNAKTLRLNSATTDHITYAAMPADIASPPPFDGVLLHLLRAQRGEIAPFSARYSTTLAQLDNEVLYTNIYDKLKELDDVYQKTLQLEPAHHDSFFFAGLVSENYVRDHKELFERCKASHSTRSAELRNPSVAEKPEFFVRLLSMKASDCNLMREVALLARTLDLHKFVKSASLQTIVTRMQRQETLPGIYQAILLRYPFKNNLLPTLIDKAYDFLSIHRLLQEQTLNDIDVATLFRSAQARWHHIISEQKISPPRISEERFRIYEQNYSLIRLAVLHHPSTPPQVLQDIAQTAMNPPRYQEWLPLVRHQHSPADVLARFVDLPNSGISSIRKAIAVHPNSRRLLHELALSCTDEEERRCILSHKDLSERTLGWFARYLNPYSPEMALLAKHPNMTTAILRGLAKRCPSGPARLTIARHRATCSQALQEILARRPSKVERHTIASRAQLPAKIIEQFVQSNPSYEECLALAQKPALSTSNILHLARTTTSPFLRELWAAHENSTPEVVGLLIDQTTDPLEKARLQQRLLQ